MAFAPIFHLTQRLERMSSAFFYFYLSGFLFFLVTWEWLRHVTYFGWIALVSLYAIYFGLFGIVVYWFLKRRYFFISLFALPSAWAVLEWMRTEIPVWGFGWNLLAYSQSSNPGVSGVASFIGVYGVSWLIMFVNLVIFFVIHFAQNRGKTGGVRVLYPIAVLSLIFGLSFLYGKQQRMVLQNDGSSIRAAVIQGNIPQEEKWDRERKASILEIHEQLSRFVSFDEKPDLIIWPEAAFPGYFNMDQERERVIQLERELQIPILFGSPHLEFPIQDREVAYNSAYLVDHRLPVENRYDKVRLVPFGEYVPWRKFFGPLGIERFAYSLGVSDFERGKDLKVFSLDEKHRFSVLICFEDTFPYLSKSAVDRGAQFLVVMTNDAWFGKSAAPYQHLQASVFRAIENGVPVIRAANTGVSAFITNRGEVLDRVKDQHGHDTFIAGGLVRSVLLGGEKTFYRTRGYQFPLWCLVFVLGSFIVTLNRRKKGTGKNVYLPRFLGGAKE